MSRRQRAVAPYQLGAIIVFLGLWEWASNTGRIDPFAFSAPSDIGASLRERLADGEIWSDMGATLKVIALGYGLGVGVGTLLGLALGVSTILRAYAEPFLVFFNAMPRVLLVPFLVTWLGFGLAPKVLVVFLVTVVAVMITVSAGVQGLDRLLLNNVRLFGASRRDLAWHVYVPSALLWIFGSARVAVGLAFQAAIVAEFFGSFSGLGYQVLRAQADYDIAGMYAALTVMAALACLIDFALSLVERRVTRWLPDAKTVRRRRFVRLTRRVQAAT